MKVLGVAALSRSSLALDEAPPFGWRASSLAFDRSAVTVRDKDPDGRMHISTTNISKAAVNPYLGREIPDYEALGLDPDKIYQLLRDPEELARAAPTFNRLPLLSEHVPVSAADHRHDLVIGTTGSDSTFETPYLKNSLVLWEKQGIDAVESETRKELSSAYRYRADMTPGTYEGKSYDGVMRDIVGNHVALVKEGRAGRDVVVGDSKLKLESDMSVMTRKAVFVAGAIGMYLTPKLAADAKIDLTPTLKKVTSKNFKSLKPAILADVTKQTKGKLAQDETIKDLTDLLDKLDQVEVAEGTDLDPSTGLPVVKKKVEVEDDAAIDADPLAKVKAYLESILTPEQMAKIDELVGAEAEAEEPKVEVNGDDPPPFAGMPKKGGEKDHDDKDKIPMRAGDNKKAMDAASVQKIVDQAVKGAKEEASKNQREVRDAERAVRPWVGELRVAMDSGEAVYRAALKHLGVKDADKLHKDALPAVLAVQPKPGNPIAADEQIDLGDPGTDAPTFEKMFPEAAKIGFA